ncbi:MAG: hypothetical protein M1524_01985 [Patescibacteria group bacterium]|nr:hypothetical protein [Patescibacteria group bacterium]
METQRAIIKGRGVNQKALAERLKDAGFSGFFVGDGTEVAGYLGVDRKQYLLGRKVVALERYSRNRCSITFDPEVIDPSVIEEIQREADKPSLRERLVFAAKRVFRRT